MENCIKRAINQYNSVKKILEDTYERSGKSLYWADAEKDFERHMLNLFLGMATCHYPISDEEVKFIESFFVQYDVKSLLENEDESINKQRTDMLLTQAPSYLKDMSNMDLYKTKLIINMISEICVELASVDMDYSEKECRFITAVSENLRGNCIAKSPLSKSILDKYRKMNINNAFRLQTNAEEEKENEQEKEEQETLEEIMDELDELIGLEEIKSEVNTLINLTKVNNIRKKRGLKSVTMSRHMVFTGSPGTGKTTIARIVARIYKALGVLSKGHLVETDRAGLVAGYVGQTAANVKKVVESAIGGILFIDEAYSLTYSDDSSDFGKEAVDALVKLMEDNRNDLIVIVAGYENEMKDFIKSNPGLESRFNKYINFKDYTLEELFEIFMLHINKNMFTLDKEAIPELKKLLEVKSEKDGFGNGRGVRNCFEKLLEIQANRIIGINDISNEELQKISKEDVLGLCNE